MARMQRDKGANFERGISKVLRSIWPKARRGIGQARSAGEVSDVEGTPYWVECKNQRRVSVRAAWRQAVEATDGRPPLVVHKENRGPILVTMEMTTFLDLCECEED